MPSGVAPTYQDGCVRVAPRRVMLQSAVSSLLAAILLLPTVAGVDM